MRTLLLTLLIAVSLPLFSQENCEITDLIVEASLCENGMFFVDIDFNIQNPGSNTFGVVGNANNYGYFSLDDLPITIGPLTGDDETEWFFIVYDSTNADCQATFNLGIVNCCSISDVVVDIDQCDNSEEFSATINFSSSNTGPGFNVYDLNENLLGNFLYENLPVSVSGIPSTGAAGDNLLIICDSETPNCCTEVEFLGPDCDPNDCEIYDVVATPTDCDNGDFFVILSFSYENTSEAFTVAGNGNQYGQFPYDSLPIILGPFAGNGETVYEFVVRDAQDNECTDFAVVQPVLCPPGCGFNDIVITTDTCVDTLVYSLWIDFIPQSVGEQGFSIFTGGGSLGSYEYGDLPIYIDSFPAAGTFNDELVICDNADTTCCEVVEFQSLICGESCLIYNVVADQSACENGQFEVVLDFNTWNVGGSGFQVGGNGNIYGQFGYDELPITLGPFAGDSMTYYEFVVLDLDNAFCLAGTELGIVDCISPCNIGELHISELVCTGNGTYNMVLDFDYVNTSNVGFDVYAGENFFGFYSYDDLPVLLENFPASGNNNDVIRVCDNDNLECCSILEYESPVCVVNCSVNDLGVDVDECTSDSTFGVFVNFIPIEFSSDSADVWNSNNFLGTYSIAELPVYVPNFPENDGFVALKVCDSGDPECCSTVEFQAMLCPVGACNISGLVLDEVACGGNGNFSAYVNFDYVGITNDFFEISANGADLGFYAFDSLPVQVDGFPGTGEVILIEICENDNPDCCTIFEYQAPDCGGGECDITEFGFVDITECEGSTFGGYIVFDVINPGNDFFEAWFNDQYLGLFAIDSLPVHVDGLPGTGAFANMTVCINDMPDCCAVIEFETPNCGGGACDITEFGFVDITECEGSTFGGYIVFDVINPGNDFFEAWFNDEYLGLFAIDSLPVHVDGLPGTGAFANMTVCINDMPDCCAVIEFETPNCGGGACDITELVVDLTECEGDGTFGAVIDFDYVNANNDFFEAWLNDNYLGLFALAELPVVVDSIPGIGVVVELRICINDMPDCCATIEVETPNCGGGGCSITELSVDPGDCDSDTTQRIFVAFDYQNLGTDSVVISSDGSVLGQYAAAQQPILIEGFPADGQVKPLLVCALDFPDCCTAVEFETEDCGPPECAIFNVVVEPIECSTDTTFNLWVNFSTVGFVKDMVDVFANGEFFGFYPAQAPFVVEDFPANNDGNVAIMICENDNPECCAIVEFPSPDCSEVECAISSLEVSASDCDTSGQFLVTLDFDVFNPPSDSFSVVGNGMQYGTFGYNELPLVLGPFDGDGETPWEFGIADSGNNDCGSAIDLGIIDCEPSSTRNPDISKLEIYYIDGHAYVTIPQDDMTLSIWSVDGRMMFTEADLAVETRHRLRTGSGYEGIFIIQLKSDEKVFVGKAFLTQ